ncbi:MAG: hypothetical protein L0338_28635 [Acidobacteria bacterium]|nr:hypothetical protein [Acidobacteriota bacterium]
MRSILELNLPPNIPSKRGPVRIPSSLDCRSDSGSAGRATVGLMPLVAFNSVATNLVSGDTNTIQDVFVHDCQAAATTRLCVTSDGD